MHEYRNPLACLSRPLRQPSGIERTTATNNLPFVLNEPVVIFRIDYNESSFCQGDSAERIAIASTPVLQQQEHDDVFEPAWNCNGYFDCYSSSPWCKIRSTKSEIRNKFECSNVQNGPAVPAGLGVCLGFWSFVLVPQGYLGGFHVPIPVPNSLRGSYFVFTVFPERQKTMTLYYWMNLRV